MFISDYQSYHLNYNLCNHHKKNNCIEMLNPKGQ